MLIKKITIDSKIKAIYSSSTIFATKFDKTTNELTVIFKNGGQYKYQNVNFTDYLLVESSNSTGADFNTYIKNRYMKFDKLEHLSKDVMDLIITEINGINPIKEDINSSDEIEIVGSDEMKLVISSMLDFISSYVSNNAVDNGKLIAVTDYIRKYNIKIVDG